LWLVFGAGEQSNGGACDDHVFVGTNDTSLDMAMISGNDWLGGFSAVKATSATASIANAASKTEPAAQTSRRR
jgi:hypothetical protein